MARKVKQPRRRGFTRLSSKNQATIPVEALTKAGIQSGDELRVDAEGRGRIVLTDAMGRVDRYAGSMTGVFGPGYLDDLRAEWDE